jgi:antirestriction protein ArdC
MKPEQIKKITEEATEKLVAALKAGHSETLRRYLKTIARFHRYSVGNVFLIASQKPEATHVAGFHTWHKLGRYVRKGEKGILILAPIVRHKKESSDDDPEASRIFGFRAASVFDISQTEGTDLPQLSCVRGNPQSFQKELLHFATQHSITIEYDVEIAPARGLSQGGKITLLPGQSPAEEFSTLVHEIAHELLHRGNRRSATSKQIRETEAEAVAFIVCDGVGLATGSAASDYIQLWNGDVGVLAESLSYVHGAATQILSALKSDSARTSLEDQDAVPCAPRHLQEIDESSPTR